LSLHDALPISLWRESQGTLAWAVLLHALLVPVRGWCRGAPRCECEGRGSRLSSIEAFFICQSLISILGPSSLAASSRRAMALRASSRNGSPLPLRRTIDRKSV